MIDSPLEISLFVSLIATVVAGVLGIAVGAWLARTHVPGRELLDAILSAPMVLPPTVLGYALLVALGRRSPIGRLYEACVGSPIVFTRTGAVIAASIAAFPLVCRAARAAIEDVDPRFVDAARTLGASPRRAFFTVVLPLARGGIAAGIALGFARALGDFGITLMLAGNVPGLTRTAPLAIYDAVQAGHDDVASANALVLAAVAIAVLTLVNRLGRRAGR